MQENSADTLIVGLEYSVKISVSATQILRSNVLLKVVHFLCMASFFISSC